MSTENENKFAKEMHKKALRDSLGLPKGDPIQRDDRQAKLDKFFEESPSQDTKKGKHLKG